MPQIPPINLPLEHAIDTASINRLRIALRHVRNHVSTTDRELQRILLVPEKRAKCEIIDLETDSEVDIQQKSGNEDEDGSSIGSEAVEEVESEQGEESEDDRRIGSNGVEDPRTRSWTLQFANATPSPKRFRPRYAECQNCEEEFDVTQNEQKLCRYHPGMYLASRLCSSHKTYLKLQRNASLTTRAISGPITMSVAMVV